MAKKLSFRKVWWLTKSVLGFLTKAEAWKLYRLAARPRPHGDIVEIGAHHGKKTAFLAAGALKSGKEVIAVDPFVGRTWLLDILDESKPAHSMEANYIREGLTGEKAMTAFWNTLERAGLDDGVSLAPVHSQETKADSDISLLVIDGDPRGDAVAQDLKNFLPRVVEGGAVVFPDAANPRFASRRGLLKALAKNPRAAHHFLVGSLWGVILGPPSED